MGCSVLLRILLSSHWIRGTARQWIIRAAMVIIKTLDPDEGRSTYEGRESSLKVSGDCLPHQLRRRFQSGPEAKLLHGLRHQHIQSTQGPASMRTRIAYHFRIFGIVDQIIDHFYTREIAGINRRAAFAVTAHSDRRTVDNDIGG